MKKLALLGLGAILAACSASSSDEGDSSAGQLNTGNGTGNADAGVAPSGGTGTVEAKPLPAMWPNHGSTDCRDHANSEAPIFKYKYDEDTFILRENRCLNFEANFLYLLFGKDKVLLQDTGSIPYEWVQQLGQQQAFAKFAQAFPLRDTVEGIINDWLAAHPNADGTPRTRDSIELLVTHSHSHGDHVSGDIQFVQPDGQHFYPHTQYSGRKPEQVAAFFGLQNWPNQSGTIDLGGRKLDVLPIPGHEPAHIAVYDHNAQILLSGDSLYPGHLFVPDWGTYRSSMQRLASWVHETDEGGALKRPIVYVLGNHIEKAPEAGKFYQYGVPIQDPERKLELLSTDIDFLGQKLTELGTTPPAEEVFYPDFGVEPTN